MNRITLFRNSKDEVVVQQERLQKQPSGNGDQRRKQLRNGWVPSWVPTGRPQLFTAFRNDTITVMATGCLPEPEEIAPALDLARIAPFQVEWEIALEEERRRLANFEFALESGLL